MPAARERLARGDDTRRVRRRRRSRTTEQLCDDRRRRRTGACSRRTVHTRVTPVTQQLYIAARSSPPGAARAGRARTDRGSASVIRVMISPCVHAYEYTSAGVHLKRKRHTHTRGLARDTLVKSSLKAN
jgi:hypothetical protein